VKDMYDVKFSCTPQHNIWYADVDLYKKKCNLTAVALQKPVVPQESVVIYT